MHLFVRHVLIAAAAALAAAACSLRPLPEPQHACGEAQSLAAVWSCIDAVPRTASRESAFRSTLRTATDLRIRVRNQSPTGACVTRAPHGFERIRVAAADPAAAPLDAYYRAAERGRPTVVVVHGIFDSRANRYIAVAARRLAESGYGVLVPDMRWHGCLYTDALPSTLGILEGADLRRWARWLRDEKGAPDVGLLGFSLGALHVLHTVSGATAEEFRAGAIAVSPPAYLDRIVERFDGPRPWLDYGLNRTFTSAFRCFLNTRLRNAGEPRSRRPFGAYLDLLAEKDIAGVGSTPAEILANAEPLPRLASPRVPTLVIVSRNDPLFDELVSRAYVDAPKSAFTHVIETRTGGHIGHIGEQPQWFSSIIASYFDAVRRLPR